MRAQSLRLGERNHVKKPLLEQRHGLGWEIFGQRNAVGG